MCLSYESSVILLRWRLRLQCRKHTIVYWMRYVHGVKENPSFHLRESQQIEGSCSQEVDEGAGKGIVLVECSKEKSLSYKFTFWICCLQHPETFLSFILRAYETRVKIGHYDSRAMNYDRTTKRRAPFVVLRESTRFYTGEIKCPMSSWLQGRRREEKRKSRFTKAYAVRTFWWLHSVSGSCTWILGRGRLCCPVLSLVAVFVVTWVNGYKNPVLVSKPRRHREKLYADRNEWLKGALRKYSCPTSWMGSLLDTFFLSHRILFRATTGSY